MPSTPPVAELKARACAAIDDAADHLAGLADRVLRSPETGYREERTAQIVRSELDRLGASPRTGLALTGVRADLRGRSSAGRVAVLGELDALLGPGHPFADPVTGAAHLCGHNAQIASMIGAGTGLAAVRADLDGDVALMAVPAEECIEVDWRLAQRAQGSFEFIVGKAEMIARGDFDDVDAAMLAHTAGDLDGRLAMIAGTNNAALVKQAVYTGVPAHAGAVPWDGVNAFKALSLGLAAIDAQRETFRDADQVRVHWLVTETGRALTAVPGRAVAEIMVRAADLPALRAAGATVDRSLRAGALALGAQVRISSAGAYLPMRVDEALAGVTEQNAAALFGADRVLSRWEPMSGSTDMGDLGAVMPVVQPFVPSGGTSLPHSAEYRVSDPVLAVLNPAKLMATTVIDLLHDDATRLREVVRRSGPKLSRQEYVEVRRSLDGEETFG